MIITLEMKNYIMILTENQQKISALPSGKIDKYEYLTGEEILSSDQRRVIKQGKFTYSLLGKVFEKQTKMIEEQGWKQIEAIEEHGKQLVRSNMISEREKTWQARTNYIEKLCNSV